MERLKRCIRRIGNAYVREVHRREYEHQVFQGINERPVEFRFVFEQLAKLCPINVLDVGSGTTALPSLMRSCGFLVTATDNIKGYWPKGMVNRHYHLIQDDITNTKLNKNHFDLITCISVLEHIDNHIAAVEQMFSLLKPGGHLILTFPYNESQYVQNAYRLPGSVGEDAFPFATQVYSRKEVNAWLVANRASIVVQEYWRFYTGECWTQGEQITPPIEVGVAERHQISCLLLQR